MSVESLRSAYRSLEPPDRLRAEAISRFAAHGTSHDSRERSLLLTGGLTAVLVAGILLAVRYQAAEPVPVTSRWSLSRLSTTTGLQQNMNTPARAGRPISSVTSATSSVVAAARGTIATPKTPTAPSAPPFQSKEK